MTIAQTDVTLSTCLFRMSLVRARPRWALCCLGLKIDTTGPCGFCFSVTLQWVVQCKIGFTKEKKTGLKEGNMEAVTSLPSWL